MPMKEGGVFLIPIAILSKLCILFFSPSLRLQPSSLPPPAVIGSSFCFQILPSQVHLPSWSPMKVGSGGDETKKMGESHGCSLCSQSTERWRKTLSTSSSQGSGQEESPCLQSTSAPGGGKGLLDRCCSADWKAVFLQLPAVTEPGPRQGLPYISLRQPWEGKGWVLVPEVRREPVPWAKLVRGLPTGWNVRWCWWWSHLAIGKNEEREKGECRRKKSAI